MYLSAYCCLAPLDSVAVPQVLTLNLTTRAWMFSRIFSTHWFSANKQTAIFKCVDSARDKEAYGGTLGWRQQSPESPDVLMLLTMYGFAPLFH